MRTVLDVRVGAQGKGRGEEGGGRRGALPVFCTDQSRIISGKVGPDRDISRPKNYSRDRSEYIQTGVRGRGVGFVGGFPSSWGRPGRRQRGAMSRLRAYCGRETDRVCVTHFSIVRMRLMKKQNKNLSYK